MSRTIDADALLADLQEILNQEVIGSTVSDFGNGIALAIQRVMAAQETTLNDLRDEVYQDAVAHGLWECTDYTVKRCIKDLERVGAPYDPDEIERAWAAQVISREMHELEASEGLDEYVEELADVVIAALSVAGKLGIDIDAEVKRKMEINRQRPWKHGKEEKQR